jgi:hypothetical protein
MEAYNVHWHAKVRKWRMQSHSNPTTTLQEGRYGLFYDQHFRKMS